MSNKWVEFVSCQFYYRISFGKLGKSYRLLELIILVLKIYYSEKNKRKYENEILYFRNWVLLKNEKYGLKENVILANRW